MIVLVDGLEAEDLQAFARCADLFDGNDAERGRGGARPLAARARGRALSDLLAANRIGLGAQGVTERRFAALPRRRSARYNRAPLPEREMRMTIERTLSIIKPDATRRNLTGAINDRFEKSGLRIIAQKRVRLSQSTGRAILRSACGASVLSQPRRIS